MSISQGLQFWAAGSITSEMMARRDLPEIGLRLQILRGKLYLQIYPDGYYYIKRSESMIQQIRDALLDFYPQLNGSSATGPFGDELPPDMDLRFDVADRPVISSRLGFARDALVAPVMTMCASADTVSTAVPDFSFDRWHDTGVGEETSLTYMELINRILSVADGKSYESRLKKATFRGHLVHPDRNLMRQIVSALKPLSIKRIACNIMHSAGIIVLIITTCASRFATCSPCPGSAAVRRQRRHFRPRLRGQPSGCSRRAENAPSCDGPAPGICSASVPVR